MGIKIIADSSTLYSIEEGRKNGIVINPLSVTLGDKSFREYEDIATEGLLEEIEKGAIPKTSQPNLADLVEIFEDCKDDEVLYISVADGISGAYNSGLTGKSMIEENENIHILNSKTLCGPHRYLVDLAKKLADAGKNISEIKAILQEKIETSTSYLIPIDFEFLRRGGRLSPLVANIASVIKLVPVMTLAEDCRSIVRHSINRTMVKAFCAIAKQLQAEGVDESYKIFISHAMAKETDLKKLIDIIKEAFPNVELETTILSPVFVSHGGPGCLAVQVIKK